MLTFLYRRILLAILTIFGVIVITFFLVRVVPSDPVRQWAGSRATPEQLELARKELGLDKPIFIQFGIYFRGLLKGDLGYSHTSHRPVSEELKNRFPATLELIFIASFFALLFGIPIGLMSANNKNSWIDHLNRLISIGAISIPTFWLALILQLIFFMILKWLPSGGQLDMKIKLFQSVPHITGFMSLDCLITGNFAILGNLLRHMIMPVVCVGAYTFGLVSRMTRSALLEILGEDYVKAALSYGLSERFVLFVYALKNSLGPTVTAATLALGYAFMNTFLVESIFSWPGIGKYVADSILALNYPAIMGVTLLSTVFYIILNMIADIIVSADPRVRL
ncbi:ABC transporter permease [Candidatus Atribacteria bacterium 1244-E10-H5-B2]|nr:MAG: ABC transporter permease [Candidatus Atribacteria bacterium 1244-E10-H5-B2]